MDEKNAMVMSWMSNRLNLIPCRRYSLEPEGMNHFSANTCWLILRNGDKIDEPKSLFSCLTSCESQLNFRMKQHHTCFIITSIGLVAMKTMIDDGYLAVTSAILCTRHEHDQLTILLDFWYLEMPATGSDWSSSFRLHLIPGRLSALYIVGKKHQHSWSLKISSLLGELIPLLRGTEIDNEKKSDGFEQTQERNHIFVSYNLKPSSELFALTVFI